MLPSTGDPPRSKQCSDYGHLRCREGGSDRPPRLELARAPVPMSKKPLSIQATDRR
jgi:hypothetical protein